MGKTERRSQAFAFLQLTHKSTHTSPSFRNSSSKRKMVVTMRNSVKLNRSVRSKRSVLRRAEGGSTPEPVAPPPPPPTPPPPAPTSASFGEVMAFSGAGPERINGRLAMLGFVAAAGAELSSAEPLTKQIGDAPLPILSAFLIFSIASIIPMLKKAKLESFGPFSPDAEMLNGRAAMLGFLALVGFELGSGTPLL